MGDIDDTADDPTLDAASDDSDPTVAAGAPPSDPASAASEPAAATGMAKRSAISTHGVSAPTPGATGV